MAFSRPSIAAKWTARGVVLACIAGASFSYVNLDKTLTLDVDGQQSTVSVFGRTVKDVLGSSQVKLAQGDQVFPAVGARVDNGDTVVVRTAKQIEVEIDGKREVLTSTAATVGEILDELGTRATGAEVSASRSDFVGRSVLRISTQKEVTVSIDGQTMTTVTAFETVRDLLLDMGVVLEEGDTVSPSLDTVLEDGMDVTVSRSGAAAETVTETLKFKTIERKDPTLLKGEKVVVQAGRVGKAVTTYDLSTLDGKESDRVVIARSIVVKPQDEIISIGTLDVANPATKVLSASESKAIAKAMVASRGWDDSQFTCLDKLWTRESNWRVTANNASSGAYGIAQAMPGSKMASVGADWRTNAKTQITWGLGYISGRYGTPCNAWAHSQARGWY